MFDPTVLLILVVVLALAFDFSNGWHDSANAIATVNKLAHTPALITVTGASGKPIKVTIDGFKLVPLVLDWSANSKVVAHHRMRAAAFRASWPIKKCDVSSGRTQAIGVE